MKKTILIIEDDATQRVMLEALLRTKMNLHSYVAENGRKALEILAKKNNQIQLVLSDIQMPIMDGLETLRHIKDNYPTLPVLMLSANDNINQAVEAIKMGALDYIAKPYNKERLIITIQNALKMQVMEKEIHRLQHDRDGAFTFDQMVGFDGGLQEVVKRGRKIAMIDLPCLIHGETGTGKELFAKAIHGESAQSGHPFIAVNCGAIPSELVESTLFGHEKGAFTGATERAIGKFREADGGTIFLDEVGELPSEAQVKLLRVLQEKEVEPVGSARPVKINVRVISATHRDLKQDVAQGAFREDLYYRLNVLDVTLPPLRARVSDMGDLMNVFLNRIAVQSHLPMKSLDEKAQKMLEKHSWPGNVRELENTIHRAFILSDHDVLSPDDFDLHMVERPPTIQTQSDDITPIRPLIDLEKQAIDEAMTTHNNNVTQAAKSLGMAKSTLYRKLKKYRVI